MPNNKTRARRIAICLNSNRFLALGVEQKEKVFSLPKAKKAAPIEGPEGKGFVGATTFADYG
jgi:hypothetical protein